jgi:hypothetical protein
VLAASNTVAVAVWRDRLLCELHVGTAGASSRTSCECRAALGFRQVHETIQRSSCQSTAVLGLRRYRCHGLAKGLRSLSRPSSDTLIASVVLGCHERNTRHFRRALAAHAHPHRLVCLYLLPHIGVSKLNEHHEETFQDSTGTTYRHLIVIGRASCSIGHSIVVHLWSFVSLDRVSTTGLDLEGMRSA